MHAWTFLSTGLKVMRMKCPSWRCVWEMSLLCRDSLKIVEIYLSVDFVMVRHSGCNCYYQLLMSDRGFQTELNCQCNEGSFKFIWWDHLAIKSVFSLYLEISWSPPRNSVIYLLRLNNSNYIMSKNALLSRIGMSARTCPIGLSHWVPAVLTLREP